LNLIIWENVVFSIIAFLILYWLLRKFAFGPLFSVMEKRREHVLNELQSAERDRKEAQELLAEQRKALENARKEAHDILEQARITSAKQAEDIISAAKEEANRIKAEALKEIENEKNKAIAQLKSQVSAMSVLIASKIIEKQIDEKTQQELVEHYMKEVGDRV